MSQPVILKEEDQNDWLSHDMVELEHIEKYLKPYSNKEMEAYPVSTRVNSQMYIDKDLLKK